MTRFFVEHFSLLDGWVPFSRNEDGSPLTHTSHKGAQKEIDEFFAVIEASIEAGLRDPDDGFDRADFRVTAKETAT